jgi:hypothetical protein
MVDPIADIARAAGSRLTAEYGSGLLAEVEEALRSKETRPLEHYLDPVSLGSLIVSTATLAWTIYSDLRRKWPEATPDTLDRALRAEVTSGGTTPGLDNKMLEVVVTEVIRSAGDGGEGD